MPVNPHRGPDDQGIFTDGIIRLGMCRLSVIDVSGGHQRIENEDGTIRVVFNGEITQTAAGLFFASEINSTSYFSGSLTVGKSGGFFGNHYGNFWAS